MQDKPRDKPIRILLIDNYDSFTYNLQHLIQMHSDARLIVKRNDEAEALDEIARGEYDGVVIGPGPGSPEDEAYFGFNRDVILQHGVGGLPILGVCLGFQGIYHAFGGKLKVAPLPMHGKISRISIDSSSVILQGIPSDIHAMRYHSIIADTQAAVPSCFNLTAYTEDGESKAHNGEELMAIEHKDYPIYGVQFHPESFATEYGERVIRNFISEIRKR